jgi:hypothetical protein
VAYVFVHSIRVSEVLEGDIQAVSLARGRHGNGIRGVRLNEAG